MSQRAVKALPLQRSLKKLEENTLAQRKHVKIQGGYSLCDLRRKARMAGWARPGDVDEASWEALLPFAAGRQLLYLMLRCFAACCC